MAELDRELELRLGEERPPREDGDDRDPPELDGLDGLLTEGLREGALGVRDEPRLGVEGLLLGATQDRDAEDEDPGDALIPGDQGPVCWDPEDERTPWMTRLTAGGLSLWVDCQLGEATVGLFLFRGGEIPVPPVRHPPVGASTPLDGEAATDWRQSTPVELRGLVTGAARPAAEPLPPVRQLLTEAAPDTGEEGTEGDVRRVLEITTAGRSVFTVWAVGALTVGLGEALGDPPGKTAF